jgi:hypothetical protein
VRGNCIQASAYLASAPEPCPLLVSAAAISQLLRDNFPIQKWVETLKALADHTRFPMVRVLIDGSKSVGELTESLAISPYVVGP